MHETPGHAWGAHLLCTMQTVSTPQAHSIAAMLHCRHGQAAGSKLLHAQEQESTPPPHLAAGSEPLHADCSRLLPMGSKAVGIQRTLGLVPSVRGVRRLWGSRPTGLARGPLVCGLGVCSSLLGVAVGSLDWQQDCLQDLQPIPQALEFSRSLCRGRGRWGRPLLALGSYLALQCFMLLQCSTA